MNKVTLPRAQGPFRTLLLRGVSALRPFDDSEPSSSHGWRVFDGGLTLSATGLDRCACPEWPPLRDRIPSL